MAGLDVVEVDPDVLVSIRSILFMDESDCVKHFVHRYALMNAPGTFG
jgi:hypothetical protein